MNHSQFINFLFSTRILFNTLQDNIKSSKLNSPPAVQTGEQKNIHLVLGNQSADLDSIVGSLTLAYYKHLNVAPSNLQALVSLPQIPVDSKDIFIPVVRCNANDLKSRFEFMHLADIHGIDLGNIICNEELNFKEFIDYYNAKLILYDHNIPSANMVQFKERVDQIVDHHEDYTQTYDHKVERVDIRQIGSATTIVAEYLFRFQQETQQVVWEKSMAQIIMGTILMDTFNFDLKLKNTRWFDQDWQIYESLTGLLKDRFQIEIDRSLYVKELVQQKFDFKRNINLGLENLFLQDYKEFNYQPIGNFGYSVLMFKPENLFQNISLDAFESKILEFFAERKIKAHFLLFCFQSPSKQEDFQREFIIYSPLPKKIFKELKVQEIVLPPLKIKSDLIHLKDLTNSYTRKIIEPLVASINFGSLL